MEITANQDQEALDYFKINIKDAERNVRKFTSVVLALDRNDQRELFESSQNVGELAAFAIGIKPVVMFDEKDKKFASQFVEISEGEATQIGNFLVWNDKAVQVVNDNIDIFNDYNDSVNLTQYLQSALTGPDTSKLGLLLGYPREASVAHAKYMNCYSSFFRTIYSDILSGIKPVDPETVKFFKNFVHNGSSDDIERSNKFRDQHENEAFVKIHAMDNFKDLTDEEIKYICSARGIQSKGLNYMGISSTESYTKVPKYVDRIFDITGMDNEIQNLQLELMTLNYESDYPVAVQSVSTTIGSILANHMSWGIMTSDPETTLKADFKEIKESLAELVSISKTRRPNPGVDRFEKDFGQGLTTITDAITQAVHVNGGIYMTGTYRALENIKGLNWVAKEALEILNHAGYDVTPIVERINKTENISTIDAAFVFREVFPKPQSTA